MLELYLLISPQLPPQSQVFFFFFTPTRCWVVWMPDSFFIFWQAKSPEPRLPRSRDWLLLVSCSTSAAVLPSRDSAPRKTKRKPPNTPSCWPREWRYVMIYCWHAIFTYKAKLVLHIILLQNRGWVKYRRWWRREGAVTHSIESNHCVKTLLTHICSCKQEAKEKRQEQIAKRRRLSSLRASQSKSESSQKWNQTQIKKMFCWKKNIVVQVFSFFPTIVQN